MKSVLYSVAVYLEHEVLPMPLVPVTSTHRVIYMYMYTEKETTGYNASLSCTSQKKNA